EHNHTPLTRDFLIQVLSHLATLLFYSFRCQVHLVVHGGAVMVLHKKLQGSRQYTRDVDFCLRPFVTEWAQRGVPNAEATLMHCIQATAAHYGLGSDWMNAHADVALPMSRRCVVYDPIYNDALKRDNVVQNTVFEAPGLRLIGVSWSWAVALKLVRFKKDDPQDIAYILDLGRKMKGMQWSRHTLEGWLMTMCSAMNYAAYSPTQREETREKMRKAIKL
ncbi:hypothetical protein C8Q75DRAFT_690868, partial [Abortiporus biennis]